MSTALPYSEFASGTVDQLISTHAELVKRIAYHMAGRMPAGVDVDDLIQAGMLGLLEAARTFRPEKGASFETFAGIRIRGAILDDMRRLDWVPRSVRRGVRELSECVKEIERNTGRAATSEEVAAGLGLSLEEYHSLAQDAVSSRMFSLDDLEDGVRENAVSGLWASADEQPEALTEAEAFREALADQIGHLPEREKLVMSLYYDDELNLREIGEVLEISESRVCQIHSQALVRLRARLGDWLPGGK